jgi:hypothetical protein
MDEVPNQGTPAGSDNLMLKISCQDPFPNEARLPLEKFQ